MLAFKIRLIQSTTTILLEKSGTQRKSIPLRRKDNHHKCEMNLPIRTGKCFLFRRCACIGYSVGRFVLQVFFGLLNLTGCLWSAGFQLERFAIPRTLLNQSCSNTQIIPTVILSFEFSHTNKALLLCTFPTASFQYSNQACSASSTRCKLILTSQQKYLALLVSSTSQLDRICLLSLV